MGKIVTIAVREFLDTVRTKAFVISVVLMPLLVMGFMFGAQWIGRLTERERVPMRRIALLDETGLLAAELNHQVAEYNRRNPNRLIEITSRPPETDLTELSGDVKNGRLYAYLRIPADVLEGTRPCELARQDQQLEAGRALERMINTAVFAVRCRQSDPPLDPTQVLALQKDVPLVMLDVQTGAAAGKEDMFVRIITPFAIMFLLFMGTMQISHGLLTSLIEEKSSRVVEVLLSAVSPTQLMAGKIIGMILVGVLLLTVWGAVGYAAAESRGYGNLVTGSTVLYAALYFVPGFLLLSAILGAIGSACNTLKEAQSMASPLTILNIVPMVLWFQISQSPQSIFNVILSHIPPITPFVMVLRLAADPRTPLWQIVTTQLVLWASVLVTIWAAGKIFRVGVLMYGKPPTPRELLRWVRYA